MESTNLTVVISRHDPEDAAVIVRLLAEHGCVPASPGDPLVEDWAYGADDVALSAADDLACDLIRLAPFTAFEAFTEPCEEIPGHRVRYAPVRGRVDDDCTAGGIVDGELPEVALG